MKALEEQAEEYLEMFSKKEYRKLWDYQEANCDKIPSTWRGITTIPITAVAPAFIAFHEAASQPLKQANKELVDMINKLPNEAQIQDGGFHRFKSDRDSLALRTGFQAGAMWIKSLLSKHDKQ